MGKIFRPSAATAIILAVLLPSIITMGCSPATSQPAVTPSESYSKQASPRQIATTTLVPELVPTQASTNSSALGWLKSLYFLVCGLGVVAGIAIIVLMAVRRAAKKTAPPSPPGPVEWN